MNNGIKNEVNVPIRFCNLPEYSNVTAEFINDAVDALMRAKNEIYGEIKHEKTSQLGTQITLETGDVIETPPLIVQAEFVIHISDAVNGNLDALYEAMDSMADGMLASIMPQIFARIGQICDATGNSINAGGQEISHDLLLDLLEKTEYVFDENGEHNTKLVVDLSVMEKIRNLPSATKEQDKRFDEIMERKRREFYASRPSRQLS